MKRATGLAVAALAAVVGGVACGPRGSSEQVASREAGGSVDVPFELVLDGVTPLISDADLDLSLPVAIDVDAEGNVWIVDQRLHQVRIVDPGGQVLRTFGRSGEGPGEFRFPRGLAIRGDRAHVLDVEHGVQAFDMAGDYLSAYQAPRIFSDFDFTGDGGLVASNNRVWARGGLVALLGPDGEELGTVGKPPFAGAEGFNFQEARDAVIAGELPDLLRNGALPVAAPDGSLWVAFHTERSVRRYGPDGELVLETIFDLPELPAIRAQWFADFASAPARDLFFFPSFIGDAVATGDTLYLLWDTVAGSPGLVTVHDGTGAVVQRWSLPEIDMGGGGFTVLSLAIDTPRRRLYVGVSEIATVFRVDLPDEALLH